MTDGKIYVGKSSNPHARWRRHKDNARRGSTGKLYNAIGKHGEKAFLFEIVGSFSTEDAAYESERETIECFLRENKKLYNVAPGGRGGFGGSASSRDGLKRHYSDERNRTRMSQRVRASLARHDVRARLAKKLTEEQVIDIRTRSGNGMSTYHELAQEHSVTPNTIWMIVTRRTWKNTVQ